jgi:hypothetical protein
MSSFMFKGLRSPRLLASPMQLALLILFLAQAGTAHAAGKIVNAVRVEQPADAIRGVVFNEVPYAEFRARFKGSTTLPYDPSGKAYSYDMPVWIITPAKRAAGNGTVIVDPFHNNGVISRRPSGSEGEKPLALSHLGPGFLFRQGKLDGSAAPNYTWVGVRWEPRSLTTAFPESRFDHVFEWFYDVSPGTLDAPADRRGDLGIAMVADLADELCRGKLTMWQEEEERAFADVKRLVAFGHSQVGIMLRQLLNDPPSEDNGGGAHHVPLFDGWLIGGAAGTYAQWSRYDDTGKAVARAPILRKDPPARQNGLVFELATEQDIGRTGAGNEFVRFADTNWCRSYEIAGASHFQWGHVASMGLQAAILLPDLADSLEEIFAIAAVDPDFKPIIIDAFDCADVHPLTATNPLDWSPVVRALFVALDDWLYDEELVPPASAWLRGKDGPGKYGDATIARDEVGNALGGIRLPDVEVGRGRFYATSPDTPFPGGNILAGAYVDRHDRFANHGKYLSAFTAQADRLRDDGFLLSKDRDALIDSAARSKVGK